MKNPLKKVGKAIAATVAGPAAFFTGGATGANLAKNVIQGQPLSKNVKGAAALDVLGLGAGAALGPTGFAANLWGPGAAAGGAGGAGVAGGGYAGADAAAFAEGISPETGEVMNLGAEELGLAGEVGAGAGAGPGADLLAGPGAGGAGGAGGVPAAAGGLGNALAKYGPLALGVGSIAYQRAQAGKYAKELAGLGAPQRAAGESLISQYQSGQLNEADKFAIDSWERNSIAQARDYYAKAGLADSSMAKNAEQEIHSKAVASRQQALNNLLVLGTNILNTTDRYQQMAIQAQMAGDQNLMQESIAFMNSYGSWLRSLPQFSTPTA